MSERECILSAFDFPVSKLAAFEEGIRGRWVAMVAGQVLHFALLTLFHYSLHWGLSMGK